MSGDIMDRRIVEPLVLSTCLQAFERLAQVAPVVAITGNHDEPLFWAEIAPYLAPRILLAASEAVFGVDTAAGRLTVACMPWPEPAETPTATGDDRGVSRAAYAELVTERLEGLAHQAAASRRDHPGPCVLLAHAMVKGGVSGGGALLGVGGDDHVRGVELLQEQGGRRVDQAAGVEDDDRRRQLKRVAQGAAA